MVAGEGKVGSGGSRQSYENEWVPNHADNAGFQPFFCLTIGTRTPADGRGWYSAAPLALFDWPPIGRTSDFFRLECSFVRSPCLLPKSLARISHSPIADSGESERGK